MQVILKRDFATRKGLFKANGKFPVEIPDSFFGNLPKSAKVVEPPKKVELSAEEIEAKKAAIVAKRKATIEANKAGKKDFTKQ